MKIKKEHGAERERKVFPTECFVMSGQTLGVPPLWSCPCYTQSSLLLLHREWRDHEEVTDHWLLLTSLSSPGAGRGTLQVTDGQTWTQNVPVSDSSNLCELCLVPSPAVWSTLKCPGKSLFSYFFFFFVLEALYHKCTSCIFLPNMLQIVTFSLKRHR